MLLQRIVWEEVSVMQLLKENEKCLYKKITAVLVIIFLFIDAVSFGVTCIYIRSV